MGLISRVSSRTYRNDTLPDLLLRLNYDSCLYSFWVSYSVSSLRYVMSQELSQEKVKQNTPANTATAANTPPDIENEKSIFSEYETSTVPKKREVPYKAFAAMGGFIGVSAWLTYSFMFKVINKGKGLGVTLPY